MMCLEPAHIVAYVQASVISVSYITGTQQILGRTVLIKKASCKYKLLRNNEKIFNRQVETRLKTSRIFVFIMFV
jgi:hypothetical protein